MDRDRTAARLPCACKAPCCGLVDQLVYGSRDGRRTESSVALSLTLSEPIPGASEEAVVPGGPQPVAVRRRPARPVGRLKPAAARKCRSVESETQPCAVSRWPSAVEQLRLSARFGGRCVRATGAGKRNTAVRRVTLRCFDGGGVMGRQQMATSLFATQPSERSTRECAGGALDGMQHP